MKKILALLFISQLVFGQKFSTLEKSDSLILKIDSLIELEFNASEKLRKQIENANPDSIAIITDDFENFKAANQKAIDEANTAFQNAVDAETLQQLETHNDTVSYETDLQQTATIETVNETVDESLQMAEIQQYNDSFRLLTKLREYDKKNKSITYIAKRFTEDELIGILKIMGVSSDSSTTKESKVKLILKKNE